jgi:single-strand selective monofunctional uracil DNA glycosylase
MADAEALVRAAARLRCCVDGLAFGPPVTHVYNPLAYAREPYEQYLRRRADGPRRVLFLGMNPGPWGMAQVGVPFGEVGFVRDWVGIGGRVDKPAREHPARPVEGFACRRSEVSGRRLWGLFAAQFTTADAFFREHLVLNYCPLMFLEESGANRTPDKLPAAEQAPLLAACDAHLREAAAILRPAWVIGIGAFAEACARRALAGAAGPRVGRIPHPSPASPAANRDWAGATRRALQALGVWG